MRARGWACQCRRTVSDVLFFRINKGFLLSLDCLLEFRKLCEKWGRIKGANWGRIKLIRSLILDFYALILNSCSVIVKYN